MAQSAASSEGELPRYAQAMNLLKARLAALPPLTPIPSERDLCEEFGMSRTTIRRALSELEKSGEINRLHGRGTFNADRRQAERKYVDHELQWFIGFDEDARMQSRSVRNRILMQTVQACPEPVASRLEIPVGEPMFVLERLRFVDEEPMCLVSSWVPLRICPELLEKDFAQDSLYGVLRGHGIQMLRARRSIEVRECEPTDAIQLEIEPGSPVILFESVGHAADDRPFEYVLSRYPAYRARFESEVRHTDLPASDI